jgi:hypothetical protein
MSSKKPADTTEKASDDGEDGTLRTKKSEMVPMMMMTTKMEEMRKMMMKVQSLKALARWLWPIPLKGPGILTTLQANPSQQCLHH